MTNEEVLFVLLITMVLFSIWLAFGIHSLSEKIDRLKLIINRLKYTHEKEMSMNNVDKKRSY